MLSPSRYARRGLGLPVVLGILVMLALLLSQLWTATRGEARLTHTLATDAEHLYRAEAVLSREIARLAARPWAVRYYARGGLDTGPHEASREGAYRDGSYRLWVRDVSHGGASTVPGLVDLFLSFLHAGQERRFHVRLSLLGESGRRDTRVRLVHFSRAGENLDAEAGRTGAAARATEAMQEADRNRITEELRLESRPDSEADPVELAEALVAPPDPDTVEARERAERTLRKAIHLLGEDGRTLQDLLPPLERERFLRRRADHTAARARSQELIDQEDADLQRRLLGSLILARSLFAEAWQLGPDSERGRELLQRAMEVLGAAIARAGEAGDLTGIDPTVLVSLHVDRARIAVSIGDEEAESQALQAATEAAGDRSLYGGRLDVDQVLAEVLDAVRSAGARTRLTSRDPLPESGFAPVTQEEVDGFVDGEGEDWEDWPADSGVEDGFWEDHFRDQLEREGEGGSGEPAGDVDRDGDGVEDEDALPGGPDGDGDGVPDSMVEDTVTVACVAERCAGEENTAACAQQCRQEAVPPITVAPPGTVGSGRPPASALLPPGDTLTIQVTANEASLPQYARVDVEPGGSYQLGGAVGDTLELGPFPEEVRVSFTPFYGAPGTSQGQSELQAEEIQARVWDLRMDDSGDAGDKDFNDYRVQATFRSPGGGDEDDDD